MNDLLKLSDYTKIVKTEAEYLLEMSCSTLGTNADEEAMMALRIEKILKETGAYGRLIIEAPKLNKSLDTILALIKTSVKMTVMEAMLELRKSSLTHKEQLEFLINSCLPKEDEH
jgi:hypothetical protein